MASVHDFLHRSRVLVLCCIGVVTLLQQLYSLSQVHDRLPKKSLAHTFSGCAWFMQLYKLMIALDVYVYCCSVLGRQFCASFADMQPCCLA